MLCFIELTALKLLQVPPLTCGVWTGSQTKRFLLQTCSCTCSRSRGFLTRTKHSSWLVTPPKGALLQQPGCPHPPRICCERRTWPPASGRRHRSITESRWLPSLTLESVPLMTAAESNRYHMCARQRGRSRALASSITLSKRVSSSSRTSPAELGIPPLCSPTASACTDPAAALNDASRRR